MCLHFKNYERDGHVEEQSTATPPVATSSVATSSAVTPEVCDGAFVLMNILGVSFLLHVLCVMCNCVCVCVCVSSHWKKLKRNERFVILIINM